jgi:starch synthase (maltosyl-transferring)
MRTGDGRCRVVIEGITPQIDDGRYPIKRVVGESVTVEADAFVDGHDVLLVVLRYRLECDAEWHETSMQPLVNDRWQAQFFVEQAGTYRYEVQAWIDRFLTWHSELCKRVAANQVTAVDLQIGAKFVEEAARRAAKPDAAQLIEWARRLSRKGAVNELSRLSDHSELLALMRRYSCRDLASNSENELLVSVDRERARFSSWYEMFPRSAAVQPGTHGSLKDVEARLEYVAAMGFDVLYLPPIHPIGTTFRKGKNNVTHAQPGDTGSPWGIGSAEGGHKAIHPELGTLSDFQSLVRAARHRGIELALDVAFQCSPDHPYVEQHPDWFRQRPDGTIQYAENPPKKYQDIFPFDFECADWKSLWRELKSVFEYWIEQGVQIFRVDNPHTKPFEFWEWCIGELRQSHPDTLFLAEAFTRPKIMYRLAKLGFTQSYTYFAWRNTKSELSEYLAELTQTEVHEYFFPNFWPNTPDILTEYLQIGRRPAFMARLVLAATLSSNYGIYGPPFEHCWTAPREPGSEEYRDSEKYQVHHHNLKRGDSLSEFIGGVNSIRRSCPSLQKNERLRFHEIDNEQIVCFSKTSEDLSEIVLVVVNLDSRHTQSGWVRLPLEELRLNPAEPYQLHSMLEGSRFHWVGDRNFVELDPHVMPAHIFKVSGREQKRH